MTPYGCECKAPFERDHGHWGVCMCPKHLELSEDHKSCIERVNKIEIGIASEDEHIRKNRCHSRVMCHPRPSTRAHTPPAGLKCTNSAASPARLSVCSVMMVQLYGASPTVVSRQRYRFTRGLGFCFCGLSITPGLQSLLDNYLSDIEHLRSISSEWSDFQKVRPNVLPMFQGPGCSVSNQFQTHFQFETQL